MLAAVAAVPVSASWRSDGPLEAAGVVDAACSDEADVDEDEDEEDDVEVRCDACHAA